MEPVGVIRPCWTGEVDYVDFTGAVALPRTGSGASIDRVVCMSRTGELVGCVGSGWTRDMDCDDFGGLVALPWTGSVEPISGIVGASGTSEPVGCENLLLVLSRPGPGPMNRLTLMVVIPELVNRLAVFVHAGPGVRKVMLTNRLAVLLILITVGCVSSVVSPQKGPMCRLTILFGFREPMTRLAVSVQDELGAWNVAIMGGLLPSPGPGPISRSAELLVRPDRMVMFMCVT